VKEGKALYKLLALVDGLRLGNNREINFAKDTREKYFP
jgi:hypothetical protein